MPRTTQTVSRRGFIKRASTLAAAVAVPVMIPCQALRSAGLPGANDRVRIGFIGAGRRAKDLRDGLPSDAQIVAISDCYLPAAEAQLPLKNTSAARTRTTARCWSRRD